MNSLRITAFFVFMLATTAISAQSFGVRAGLNYSTWNGPTLPEESYGYSGGFHFGVTYSYPLTDIFDLKFELTYIQNGSTYEYNGDSYYIVRWDDNVEYEPGELLQTVNNSLAYIYVPILLNFEINEKFEVFGGIYTNLLVGPSATGEQQFISSRFPTSVGFIQSLDYDYYGDNILEGMYTSGDNITVAYGEELVSLPRFAGAYYQYNYKAGSRLKTIDFGLSAGFNYYLNKGFYFGVRAEYGLVDVTRDDVDVRQDMLDENNQLILSDDNDTHLGFQFSFGFRF